MTYKALEDYFLKVNMKDKTMELDYTYSSNAYEEPLTRIYFSIESPAVEHYPKNEHTLRLEWQDGARWHDIVWEVCKVLEAHYGYDIKNRVFYKVHELSIEAEDSHGDPDLAKQMFSKELS